MAFPFGELRGQIFLIGGRGVTEQWKPTPIIVAVPAEMVLNVGE
jgi:hypothetical protein